MNSSLNAAAAHYCRQLSTRLVRVIGVDALVKTKTESGFSTSSHNAVDDTSLSRKIGDCDKTMS